MKGTIIKSVGKLVVEKFGEEKWEQCLNVNGFDTDHVFLVRDDVDDAIVMKIINSLPEILGLTIQDIIDAFGDYWVNVYSPQIYHYYYQIYTSLKEFIFATPKIHNDITANIPNAVPPNFVFTWLNDKELKIEYYSKRNMVDFAIALIRGLAKYYNEKIDIQKKDNSAFVVYFETV